MIPKEYRATRHLGTFYYAGGSLSGVSCGHRHATVRAALVCQRRMAREVSTKIVIYMAHLGMLPGKPLG